ncbi:adenylate/guanylate cyclase domain-containing protein [Hoeflea prorocentri]|uniref:Adenylate/guanylate cyclase domain-containing protein n=1 Tax=Hoeflea prorocentri TaxID=1922333 RepID=A0A9X3ZJJ0_9HYPH|nr:adenylate/guanylate cyclase domain-containing protein [Hoeflea prorocentri]MCY6382845.1 adenylate/guanylate cyclase domain-containing protein [Hoeflea prorocentri]MDA5400645.1 adenylate/guanylate cyclase domain-containing protein [Hoeflea prorocentri]
MDKNNKQETRPRFPTVEALTQWMIDGARPSADAREIITGICDGLVGLGVQIDRFVLFIYTLHPNLLGTRFRWIKGQGVDISHAQLGTFNQEIYTSNPLPRVVEKQVTIRRHLERPDCPEDYIIVGELREQGFTDYLAQPLIFTTGETNVCTWSSAQKGGFSEDDLEILRRVNPPLARLTETYMLRLNSAVLLSTYVGRNSGTLIRDGKVHRGDGEEITAVILFVDLKNFTQLSNERTGPELVALLNDTFDQLVPPVTARGGEILKFMGDGFFAIFPYEDEEGLAAMTGAAMDAVSEGMETLAENPTGDAVSFRTALHCGTFHYGNIGGGDRLDFTAIGPPVNYTARLLSAAADLGCDNVVSDALARYAPERCDVAGSSELKGFEGEQTIWRFR